MTKSRYTHGGDARLIAETRGAKVGGSTSIFEHTVG